MGVTSGMIVTAIGIVGVVVSLVLQSALVPVFRRQRKKLLKDLMDK